MISFGGEEYYINLENLDSAISVGDPKETVLFKETKVVKDADNKIIGVEETESESELGKQIDASKHDVLRAMIEVVMDYSEELDDTLGVERALDKTPLSFRVAFNTLYEYGVLDKK